jgi:subtilisin family serine protease
VGVVAAADRTRPGSRPAAAQPGVVGVVDSAAGPAPAGLVAAPGSDLPTTLPGARWGTVSGASYAAAQVSGLVALMVEARASRTAVSRSLGGDLVVGADGRVDACASLLKAGARCACDCPADRLAATDARR